MRRTTWLLGTVAAITVAASAQAADLSLTRPVDHARVCDAFGAGFWYIPGSDTCIRIGGLLRTGITFHRDTAIAWANAPPSHWSWDMDTKVHLSATTRSMTELGLFGAFAELRAHSQILDTSNLVLPTGDIGTTRSFYLEKLYLELGNLLLGRTTSIYDYPDGFNWKQIDDDSDVDTFQARLTWAMNGFGIQLAVEDPRDRWGTDLSEDFRMPDFIGDWIVSSGRWSARLSGGFAETVYGSGFGAKIDTTLDCDRDNKLLIGAAWAENKVWRFATRGFDTVYGSTSGSVWSVATSFQHFWGAALSSAVSLQHYSQDGGTGAAASAGFLVVGNFVWTPTTDFAAGAEGSYNKASTDAAGTWAVKVRLQRSW